MAVTKREIGGALLCAVIAPSLSLGALLAWNGLWAVGVPLIAATIGSIIWFSWWKERREVDDAIARAAQYEAGEHGQADDATRD